MTNREREKQAVKLIADVMNAVGKGDLRRAVTATEALESRFADTVNFMINAPACLIETGDTLGDRSFLERGISLGAKALERLPNDSPNRGMLHFNIANGHYGLFKLDLKSGKEIDYYDYQPLQSAKTHFRQAIESRTTEDELRKQAMVNLANVYDSLGRTVEAIHLYERTLRLDESFAMAKANLGQALTTFATICGEYRGASLAQAHQLITEALSRRNELQKIGGVAVVNFFEARLKQIASYFRDPSMLSKPVKHPALNAARLTKIEQAYYQFCHENRLFLNFHIHMSDVLCKASVVDNIMFSLIERPKDKSRFFHLTKYVNQIKEDFATARYLLFESMHKRPYITRISKITRFVDTLDYIDNNLYFGMARASFERVYSILDKIGVFLDEYLHLQTKGRIYFTTIWALKCGNDWKVKETIRQNKQPGLLGLYDVNRDFRTGEYEDIVSIRNALVHDRISLVNPFFLGLRDRDDGEMVVDIDRFTERTIELFLIVKSCVSNLINFVNREEEGKKSNGGVVVPLFYYHQNQTQ